MNHDQGVTKPWPRQMDAPAVVLVLAVFTILSALWDNKPARTSPLSTARFRP